MQQHQRKFANLGERLAITQHRGNVILAVLATQEKKPWLLRRPIHGQYETIMAELHQEYPGDFKAYLRMELDMFQELYTGV